MRLDLGVDPHRTLIGLGLFVVGASAEVYVVLHITTVPFWLAFCGPLVFGIGGGMLLGQWHKTKRIRAAARKWADANPVDDENDGPYEDAPEGQPDVVRYKRAGRGERREHRLAQQTPAEDNPHWAAYAARWVGKPENPTDESDEKDDSD